MMVIPELEREAQLLWKLRDYRKVLIYFIISDFANKINLGFLEMENGMIESIG